MVDARAKVEDITTQKMRENMHQINTTTKKFTEAVTIDLGQLPVIDAKIDFRLNDGTNPVIAEGKTFEMTIGSVQGNLYKTDGDTVSFRYLKFGSTNVSATPAIVIKMEGVEILNDTISLTYQASGEGGASGAAWGQITGSLQDQSDLNTALAGKISFPSGGSTGQFLQKTATGVQWATVQGGGDTPQPTPTITAPSSQSVEGTQGEELAASITTGVSASNGASVSYSVKQGSALPAGLALSATGDVTGTPTAAGSTTTTVVLSAEGCDSVEMPVSFTISEAATGGTETRTAKAFGHPGTTVANMYNAALQTYTYAGTFQVGGETFPYFTGGGATPWYLFGGKARLNNTSATVYAVYLSSDNPSTMDFNEWQMTFCRVDLDSPSRLIMLGETGNGLTYADVSGKLPASILSSGAWWRVADADYNGTQGSDTMVWEDGSASASDGFPKSFTVTSVMYQGQSITPPCGTYTRTGEAFPLTASSVAYPVYSYTGSDNKAYYICMAAYMFGGDGPAWMLTGTKPTSSSVTNALAVNSYGGTTLNSGTYEPADTQWTGSDGNATVSWEM